MDKTTALERLTRFDLIRVSKLLEMSQDAIIIFAISFYVGSALDRFFHNLKPVDDNMSNMELIGILLAQFVSIVIVAYYIRKIVDVVPFFLSLSSQYVSNQKNEAESAAGLAMSIILVSVQKNFASKLSLLKSRFALN